MNTTDCASTLCRAIACAAGKGLLRKAVFSRPKDKNIIKAVVSPVKLGDSLCLQAEYFHSDNKATHKNIPLDGLDAPLLIEMVGAFCQVNVITSLGECEYKESLKGKTALLGGYKLLGKLENAEASGVALAKSNNREKNYILDGSEPFLQKLGVADKNGRVYDKKQSKFRQINRFLELVRDVEDRLPEGEIRICDLCCGKSYLSFAVYHYFANVKKYKVQMTGVDLSPTLLSIAQTLRGSWDLTDWNLFAGMSTVTSPKEIRPSLSPFTPATLLPIWYFARRRSGILTLYCPPPAVTTS